MVLLISSIAPALIIMFLAYKRDLEKEPIKMLTKAFFGGILAVLIAVAIALSLKFLLGELPRGFVNSFFNAFFLASGPEEFAKWLIFYWLIYKSKHFDQYYDGILYAIFISMGFAMIENMLYVMGPSGGMNVAMTRAILSVPGHMLFVIPMGYFLSLAKFENGKNASIYRTYSLLIPIILHGLFDFFLFSIDANYEYHTYLAVIFFIAFVIFDIFLWRLGLRKIKKHLSKDKSFS